MKIDIARKETLTHKKFSFCTNCVNITHISYFFKRIIHIEELIYTKFPDIIL